MRKGKVIITLTLVAILVSMVPQTVKSTSVDQGRKYEDWIPIKNTRVFDEKILISGKLVVEDGIELILEGCELVFNISQETSGGVEVQDGGRFIMRNSTLRMIPTSRNPSFINHGFIDIFGSRIQNLSGAYNGEEGGIQTWNGKGIIDTTIITSCENSAVYCFESNVTIKDTAIFQNPKNGIFINNSEVTIKDCHIYENGLHGIEGYRSNARIIDNSIHDHEIGWNEGHGISLQDSLALIQDNEIKNNAMNIVCSRSQTRIIGNEISNGYYGIQVNAMIGADDNADSPSSEPDAKYPSVGVIQDNVLTGQGFFGIQVFESDYDIISNTVRSVHSAAIIVRTASPLIKGNTVSSGPGSSQYYTDFSLGNNCNSIMVDNNHGSVSVNTNSFVDIINSGITYASIDVGSYSWARLKKYFTIHVLDENEQPVNGAFVEVFSEKMNESFSGFTDPNGTIEKIPLTVFQKSAPDYASWVLERYDYSPYRIYASKEGVGAGKEYFDIEDIDKITITLDDDAVAWDTVPEIIYFQPLGDQEINISDVLDFSFSLSTPLPDGFHIEWYINSYKQTDEGYDFSFITNGSSTGGYEIKVIVTDGYLERKHNWTVWVNDPDLHRQLHVSRDSDRDGMDDGTEIMYFRNLDQVQWEDYDGDGITNYEELKQYSDPTDPDDPNGDSNPWWPDFTDDDDETKKTDSGAYLKIGIPVFVILLIIILVVLFIIRKRRTKH